MWQKRFVVGPFQCNCWILACDKTKEAIVIDPGDEPSVLLSAIEAQGINVKYLLHTHAHLDHVGATRSLKAKGHGDICLHQADKFLYDMLPLQGQMFGLTLPNGSPIDKFIEDEEELHFGEHKLKVIHTPGHSPGGVCFQVGVGSAQEQLFSGDTLFQMSVGRTDLWGADQDLMFRSIKDRLFTLEDELPVHPGHGPSTSIGFEKSNNPFFN
jgi:glyoxylase-like metal-dependent hydrolase (beta-lactamase superfamily II)